MQVNKLFEFKLLWLIVITTSMNGKEKSSKFFTQLKGGQVAIMGNFITVYITSYIYLIGHFPQIFSCKLTHKTGLLQGFFEINGMKSSNFSFGNVHQYQFGMFKQSVLIATHEYN